MPYSPYDIESIREWLGEVMDPEIPVLSITDMGIIREIAIEGHCVKITITPTFVGCPALDAIREEITNALKARGIEVVTIEISYRVPWTSNDITERGRQALKRFGLAPPPNQTLVQDISVLEYATCPRCGGRNTELRSPFGATLCRSIHYCLNCLESFEQFKPV
jgi:ring-1,2-phenylacetyl-CoA epoxidase subunit PaaD